MSTPRTTPNPATSFSHPSPPWSSSSREVLEPRIPFAFLLRVVGILSIGLIVAFWPSVFVSTATLALAEELDRRDRRRAATLRESLIFEQEKTGRLTDRVMRAEQRVAELTEELARERDQALRDRARRAGACRGARRAGSACAGSGTRSRPPASTCAPPRGPAGWSRSL